MLKATIARCCQRCSAAAGRRFLSKILRPDLSKVRRKVQFDPSKAAAAQTNNLDDLSIYEVIAPPNNVNSILPNGFTLATGDKIESGPGELRGLLLLGHESFEIDLRNAVEGLESGRVEIAKKALAPFEVVYPKPELLALGLGSKTRILGPKTRQLFVDLGIQVQAESSRQAASSFNLLASERGKIVGALLLPPHV